MATFAWDDPNVPGASSFQLWRDLTAAFSNPAQIAISTTTTVSTVLPASQRSWFSVKALDSSGNISDFSNTNTVSTVPPAVPVITSANITLSNAVLVWSPVTTYQDGSPLYPGETVRYQVFKGPNLTSITNVVGQIGVNTSIADPSPSSGITQYVVRASILSTNIFSQSVATQVVILKPTPPKALRLQAITVGP